MACEAIQAHLAALQQRQSEILQELKGLAGAPGEAQPLRSALQKLNEEIFQTQHQLHECLGGQPPPPPPVAADRGILEILYVNPSPPDQADAAWPTAIVGGTDEFPSVGREWVQVLAPQEDYDDVVVGASGWVIGPELSGADFPFAHPFGTDWEFYFAVDPEYGALVAPGNSHDTDQLSLARNLRTATNQPIAFFDKGLLGVEMDAGLIPSDFMNAVKEGDRVAVFGRWIVDSGHFNGDDGGFRTEIHPPLLMASAGERESAGGKSTRVLFTSRPYLVGQKYAVDTGNVYNDETDDDGTFKDHITNEVLKAGAHASLRVEAHPKIKSHPFRGAQLLEFIVRPPPAPGPLGAPRPRRRLSISFRFVVRSTTTVQVVSRDGEVVHVRVFLNGTSYVPPPLPPRSDREYSKDELEALSAKVDDAYLKLETMAGLVGGLSGGAIGAVEALAVLERGVVTDEYPAMQEVGFLGTEGAVTDASPATIPAGGGVLKDDNQPYPIYGWLETRWVDDPGQVGGKT